MAINIGGLVGGAERDSLYCLQPQFRVFFLCELHLRDTVNDIIPLLGWPIHIFGYEEVSFSITTLMHITIIIIIITEIILI